MDLVVICKNCKEFLPLESIEVEEYIDKDHGTAVKFICPFCKRHHVSMVMERPL